MKTPKKDEVLRLRIPSEEKQSAEAKAVELGISTSALARIALKMMLAAGTLTLPRING